MRGRTRSKIQLTDKVPKEAEDARHEEARIDPVVSTPEGPLFPQIYRHEDPSTAGSKEETTR